MMDKLILSSSYDWQAQGQPSVELLKVSSKGPDRDQFTKSAALFEDKIASIKSEPGTSVLHVIAMGASDRYGPNKNADGFKRAMLQRSHPTFVTNGHVFKEHDNDDPKKASGSVLHSAYNDPMDRVELIIRVKNAAWSEELQKVANNQDITVSMSCRVPYDVCSYCGNHAPTRASYCDHMRKYAGQMLDDGHLVHCDNPFGTFFDISGVRKQADRIAYGLRKVASLYTPVITGAELFDMWRGADGQYSLKSANVARKLALLKKLAAIEKEVEITLSSPDADLSGLFDPGDHSGESIDSLRAFAGDADERMKEVLQAMGDAQISLPLREFVRLCMPKEMHGESTVAEAEQLLPGIFSRMLSEGDESCCEDGKYDIKAAGYGPVSSAVRAKVAGVVPFMSFAPEVAKKRLMLKMARGGSNRTQRVKKASAGMTPEGVGLAREYAKYKLAFVDGTAGDCVSPLARLSILQNFFA